MNKTANDMSLLKNLSLSKYRKSIFSTDNTYGAIVVLLSFALVYIFDLSNKVFYLICLVYLILCLFIHFLLKKKNYQAAVFLNLIGSLVILSSIIFVFGNSFDFRFFFLSISLSAFIYTSNQQFNKLFFFIASSFLWVF